MSAAEDDKDLIDQPELWLEQYGDYLYRYAILYVRDSAQAEDLVQDTLLSGYRARKSFEGRSTLRTWLTSILRNKIFNHLKRSRRESPVDLTQEGQYNEDEPGSRDSFRSLRKMLETWSRTPERDARRKDFMRILEACIAGLPDNLREVLVLQLVEGLSRQEVCEKLGISDGNARVMIHRARERLKTCVRKQLASGF